MGKRLNKSMKERRLTEARLIIEEGISVCEAFRVFKDAVNAVAAEVMRYRPLRIQSSKV